MHAYEFLAVWGAYPYKADPSYVIYYTEQSEGIMIQTTEIYNISYQTKRSICKFLC